MAPVTVKYCVLQGGEDYVAVKNFYHRHTKAVMDAFKSVIHPEAKLTYRFEWNWTTAGQVHQDLPLRGPGVVDVRTLHPDKVVALLHSHALAHFPGFTHEEAGQFMRMAFEGRWQVHVAKPQYDRLITPPNSLWVTQGIDAVTPDAPGDECPSNDDCTTCYAKTDIATIDQRMDALDPDPDGCFDEYPEIPIDALRVRSSGLANYAAYSCKGHIPKPYSRHRAKAAGHQQSTTLSLPHNNGSTGYSDSVVRLTPEQMVIAFHGDAELKASFHNKRLMHSCGTRTRQTAKVMKEPIDVASTVSEEINGEQVLREIKNSEPWTHLQFISRLSSACVIAITTADVKSVARIQNNSRSGMIGNFELTTYTYKVTAYVPTKRPLFSWLEPNSPIILNLGCRSLHPP